MKRESFPADRMGTTEGIRRANYMSSAPEKDSYRLDRTSRISCTTLYVSS
jgi:hypothetical protein